MNGDELESGLQFVDTNILVYAYDTAGGIKHEQARSLMTQLWENGNGCLSVQVLEEFFVIVTRKITHPLPAEKVAEIISDLATWKVHMPSPQDILEAVQLHQRYHIAFWDAMILHSASEMMCQTVWSEDFSSEQEYQGIRVQNPFAK